MKGYVNKTGGQAAGSALIASAAGKQIRLKKIIVSVGKVEALKILKFSAEDTTAVPFFQVPLSVAGVYEFNPTTPEKPGEDFALPADEDLDYTDNATGSAVDYSVFYDYQIDDTT